MWNPTLEFLNDLLYKRVQVMTDEKSEHIGWVFTADPVSHSIVLVQMEDSDSLENLRLIPGSSIDSVQILDDQCDEKRKRAIDELLSIDRSCEKEDEKSIVHRKEKIIQWLIKNRIPIEDTPESIRVFDVLEIRRPFNIDSCLCTNEIVLARVRKVLESMPDDF